MIENTKIKLQKKKHQYLFSANFDDNWPKALKLDRDQFVLVRTSKN